MSKTTHHEAANTQNGAFLGAACPASLEEDLDKAVGFGQDSKWSAKELDKIVSVRGDSIGEAVQC